MAQRIGFELAAKASPSSADWLAESTPRLIKVPLTQRPNCRGVGCGVDIYYPPENRKLADAMLESGSALISELPVGTPPLPENFPPRNRLISGLCLGVIVVEAAEKSGSLITARIALKQDRQVFAVPGSPLTGKTRGSNRLIREGARLVECVEDVIEELAPQLAADTTKAQSIDEKSAGESPVALDEN